MLQVDSPDLAMERHRFFGHLDERAFLKQLELHVAAINAAIGGIPRDRVRLHVCWGNNDGPHIYDIAMASILPELYRANVGALSIEFANPRHQHEYEALRAHPLPSSHAPDPGRAGYDDQFRRAPAGSLRAACRRPWRWWATENG